MSGLYEPLRWITEAIVVRIVSVFDAVRDACYGCRTTRERNKIGYTVCPILSPRKPNFEFDSYEIGEEGALVKVSTTRAYW